MIPNAALFLDNYYTLRQAKGEYPLSLYNMWIGGQLGILQDSLYFFILPLLTVLPYADSLYTDKMSGYERNVLIRTSKLHYWGEVHHRVFDRGRCRHLTSCA